MIDAIFILKWLERYVEDIPLGGRAWLAAELIHGYRRSSNPPSMDKILEYLRVTETNVAPVYRRLYGMWKPLHQRRIPLLQENEVDDYIDSTQTGLSYNRLWYLWNGGLVELRRSRDGQLRVNRVDWENRSVPLYSAKEMLGVSADYLKRLIREGILPAIVIEAPIPAANRYQITIKDLESLKTQLEWVNLSQAGDSKGKSRERMRQILKDQTKGKKRYWRRRRTPHEVFVRRLDVEKHFANIKT